MTITRDDVQREVNKFFGRCHVFEGDLHVKFRHGPHDSVVSPALIQIGECRDDDLRTAEDRAARLAGEWFAEAVASDEDRIERAGRLIAGLLIADVRLEKERQKAAAAPEHCPWCGKNAAGHSREEIDTNRAEQDAIRKELGLS